MDYKPGQSIQFADLNATVSDDVAGIVTGMVNGPPIKDDAGNTILVPAFTERDNGREAATVYVAVENILA